MMRVLEIYVIKKSLLNDRKEVLDMSGNVKELPKEVLEEMLACACACGAKVGHGGGTTLDK